MDILIVGIDRRLPLSGRQMAWRLLSYVPLSVGLAIFYAYVAEAMSAMLGTGSFAAVANSKILIQGLRGMILSSLLTYWLILGGWLANQYYEHYLSSELRLERLGDLLRIFRIFRMPRRQVCCRTVPGSNPIRATAVRELSRKLWNLPRRLLRLSLR